MSECNELRRRSRRARKKEVSSIKKLAQSTDSKAQSVNCIDLRLRNAEFKTFEKKYLRTKQHSTKGIERSVQNKARNKLLEHWVIDLSVPRVTRSSWLNYVVKNSKAVDWIFQSTSPIPAEWPVRCASEGTIKKLITSPASTIFRCFHFSVKNPISVIAPNQLIRIQSFGKMLKNRWLGINDGRMMYENPWYYKINRSRRLVFGWNWRES